MIQNICDRLLKINSHIFVKIPNEGLECNKLRGMVTQAYLYKILYLLRDKDIITIRNINENSNRLYISLTDKGKQISDDLQHIIELL